MIKVEIENYFGNTIMNLEFYVNLKKRGVTNHVTWPQWKSIETRWLFVFEEIANKHGYNVADLEEENHIRLQQVNVDDDNEREDLIKLVNELTEFIM
jgi:hypothetical protein